ncbi:hypothetical protein OG840_57175 [Streptomyces sp. NBC_01764]|jgi:hypothetical protein|uniref:hypothetical protein n=1 Tax=Streptomyces sp. NBC_01764 TaxID=2975935 RepID=UPI00225A8BB1|nr:hypothetical protein [Streptomyces sp. NBC_01764]MCX4410772.1 hypothetical protein [Streptomyces sp. NBC_01764]
MTLAVLAGTMGMTGEASAASKTPCRSARLQFNPAFCGIKSVKYHGLAQGKNSIAIVQGRGPMTLTLTAIETVSNTKSATITVSAEPVSAAVGFDVTKSRTKSMAGSWNVPRGKFGTLKAYPLYEDYSFSVYSKITGKDVGKGTARKAIGYRYEHSAR